MMPYNPEWREHYIFLEVLRQSGATNMFGATPYLVEHCDLDRKTAHKVLKSWMDNYDQLREDGVIPQ
tara:strand:+ start:325 stop:525 length:201 start_codon:yes stop_codon:yes gene_type:complete